MRPLAFIKKIKAKEACVLYFPQRLKNNIIFGSETTRRRIGEEWVQFSLDPIEVEVRLEGNNAIPLEDIFQAELVAKLIVRIDDTHLEDANDSENSLKKVFKKFRCTTTTYTFDVLGKRFFEEKVKNLLTESIYEITPSASYKKLLVDPKHKDEIQKKLVDKITPIMKEAGFIIIYCKIQRFVPLRPDEIGLDEEITKLWLKLEKQKRLLEIDKEAVDIEIEEARKRKKADERRKTEAKCRQDELDDQKELKEFEEQKKAFEIERARNEKDKELQIAAINETAKEKHRDYQQKEIDFKNKTQEAEIARKNRIEEEEIQARNKKEKLERAHEAEMRKQKMQALLEELEQHKIQAQVAEIKTKTNRLEGLLEAEILEAKNMAQHSVKREQFELEAKRLKEILEHLPEIIKNVPTDNNKDTTLIQFSGSDDMAKGIGGVAMIYWPLIKDLIASISQRFSVQEPSNNSAENVK